MENYKRFSLKIVCAMLLLIVAFCFCACAQVNATTIANDNGSVDELVSITLNEQQFTEAGYNYPQVKNDIFINANEIVNNIILLYNQKAMSNTETQVNYNKLYKTENTGVWEGNTFKIGLHFEDLPAYKFYYGITDETSNEPIVEKHFLYDKIIIKGHTLFANYNSLYIELSKFYSEKYPLLADQENELYYTNVLNYRREKSDADFVEKVGNKYYHTWKLAPNETDKEITIYYKLANRANCVLVCIIASVLVCAILLLIGFIIAKVKSKNSK